MTTTIAKFLIVITALFAPSHLYAQSLSAQKSRPEGRGMLVGGIVTTSVLSGAGALSAFIWMFSGDTNYLLAGVGLVAVGAGVGVPMMVIGGKKYRTWKKSQAAAQESGALNITFSDLSSTAQDQYMQIKEQRTKTPQFQLKGKPVALPLLAYEF